MGSESNNQTDHLSGAEGGRPQDAAAGASSAESESQRFLQAALDALGAQIAVLDEHGRILAINQTWRGYRADPYSWAAGEVGEDYLKVLERHEQAACGEGRAAARGIRDVIEGRRASFELDYECRRAGERRWFLLRVTRFAAPGPVRAVVAHEEITDRKRDEAALREREESLHLAVDAAHLGTWDWDIEQDVSVWGGHHAQLFGMPGRTSIGYEEFIAMVHPDDRALVTEATARAVSGGEEYNVEFRIVRPDGSVRWMRDQGIAYRNEEGRATRMIGVVQDVTAHKRAEIERELRLAQERELREVAEAASRSKDEFLAVISHELRSPLNAMLGWTRVLQTRLDDRATLAHGLEIIERSARSQQRLIEDLLDTARIITGKLRLETGPADLIYVINNALDVMRPAAEARGITIKCEFDERADLITGDADRLQQVVWNLLSNAIKFTPEGGRVEVKLERVDPYAQITVSDTGIGIRPDFLPQVFNRFHQADATSTRRHGGLGLGLALVRHIVELHGGTVAVTSAGENQGAQFTVKLPLRAVRVRREEFGVEGSGFGVDSSERRTAGAEPRTLNSALVGLSALVVDDDTDAREIITILLRQLGVNVTAVASAEEAWGLLSHQDGRRFDVVVSDLSMPEVGGYELIRRLRERERGAACQTPAVALTAFGRPEDRVQALIAGFQTHLTKPVELAELAAVIAALTGRAGQGMNA